MKQRLFAAMTLLCTGLTLSAQQFKSLSSVALFKVSPGQEDAFIEKTKAFVPTLDKLLADGTISAYGADADLLHVPGETNVAVWYDTPDFASMQKAETAIEEFMKSNPRVMGDLRAMADASAHRDLVIGSRVKNLHSVPAGVKPVNDFDMVRVKPGRLSEFQGLFEKYDQPVLDKLVADGVIYGYELDAEAVHTTAPGMVWVIVVMPDLGTKDKVNKAFDESFGKLPAAERTTVEKLYYEMVDPATHRDSLSISELFKNK